MKRIAATLAALALAGCGGTTQTSKPSTINTDGVTIAWPTSAQDCRAIDFAKLDPKDVTSWQIGKECDRLDPQK